MQILLFATLAIELKRRAPNAHTFLEVIRARYGTFCHITFMVFGLVTNILVSLMLIVGGSATVSALTGVHTIAAIYLLPVGVVAYTMVGGLKATILTDWIHTFILLVIIIVFSLSAYASSDILGSPGAVYDLLVKAATDHPVDGNKDGSYLTMQSREGAIFFVINIVGNFGTVFLDNGYYNKAIAASPVYALPGYIIGGLSWFAIPWLTATTMGLSALALESNPRFPTYPDRMPDAEVSAGLVLPYAAVALLGKGGAVATLLIVFMAVTSATSSELIAVSSIFTYDLYRTYFKPDASGKRLIWMSHIIVVAYALFIATFSVGLWYAGISMGYLYVMMGVIISSAVLPATLALTWSGQNKWAVRLARQQTWPRDFLLTAVTPGLIIGHFRPRRRCYCLARDGQDPVQLSQRRLYRLQQPHVGWQRGGPAGTHGSDTYFHHHLRRRECSCPTSRSRQIRELLILPQDKYDWQSMMDIRKGDDHDLADSAGVDLETVPGGHEETAMEFEEEQRKLVRAGKISKTMTIVMT